MIMPQLLSLGYKHIIEVISLTLLYGVRSKKLIIVKI